MDCPPKKVAVVERWPLGDVQLYHNSNRFQSLSTFSIRPSLFVFAVSFMASSCSE